MKNRPVALSNKRLGFLIMDMLVVPTVFCVLLEGGCQSREWEVEVFCFSSFDPALKFAVDSRECMVVYIYSYALQFSSLYTRPRLTLIIGA